MMWCGVVQMLSQIVIAYICSVHKIVRDLGFMIPDLMHLILPIWVLRRTRAESFSARPFYRDKHIRRDLLIMSGAVFILFTVCSML